MRYGMERRSFTCKKSRLQMNREVLCCLCTAWRCGGVLHYMGTCTTISTVQMNLLCLVHGDREYGLNMRFVVMVLHEIILFWWWRVIEVDQKYKLSFSELVRENKVSWFRYWEGKSIYKILKMLRILLCSESVSEKGSLDKFWTLK